MKLLPDYFMCGLKAEKRKDFPPGGFDPVTTLHTSHTRQRTICAPSQPRMTAILGLISFMHSHFMHSRFAVGYPQVFVEDSVHA